MGSAPDHRREASYDLSAGRAPCLEFVKDARPVKQERAAQRDRCAWSYLKANHEASGLTSGCMDGNSTMLTTNGAGLHREVELDFAKIMYLQILENKIRA